MEKAQIVSEERYRLLFEDAPFGIFRSTLDGRFLEANTTLAAMLGYASAEEMIASVTDIASQHYAEPEQRANGVRQALSTSGVVHFENVYKRRNGELWYGNLYLRAMRDEQGQVLFLQGFVEDISERRRAEELLRLMEFSVDTASMGVFWIDPSGDIVYVNRLVCERLGWSREELLCMNVADIDPYFPGMRRESQWARVKTEKSVRFESAHQTRAGKIIPVEVTSHYVAFGKRELEFAFVQDISDRKRVDEQRIAYQQQLRSLASRISVAEQEERKRVAVGLHDRLAQNLAFCKMALGRVRKSSSVEQRQQILDEMGAILEASIRETRTLIFELSPPLLRELGLVSALHWLSEDIERQCGLHCRVIEADSLAGLDDVVGEFVFQAVRELLINAVKHAHAKSATVTIQKFQDAAFEIVVQDDGDGFDPALLQRTPSKSHKFGLFNIKERVTVLGGVLTVQSQTGKGSRVTVSLPLADDS